MSALESAIAAADLGRLPRCENDCLGDLVAEPGWATAAEHRWQQCGVSLHREQDLIAYGLVAPAWHCPGSDSRESRHGGAVLVALWVDPMMRGRGIARQVLHRLAALLVRSRTPTMDAVGSRFRPTCLRPGVRVLQRSGFHVHADHPTAPRMRLDLNATAPAQSNLRDLWDRLTAGVRPEPPPVAAPRMPHPARMP